MDPNDPNPNPTPEADGLDAAIAGEGGDATTESLDDALGESLDRALSESDGADGAGDPPAAGEPIDKTPPADAAPAAEPVPGSPEAAAAEAAAKEAATAAAPAQPDADVEAEITALGLKEKSAARFRELTAEVKELAPIRDQLAAAGIKDLAELPKFVERSKAADDMIGMVMETGASADQYGYTLDYLKMANAAAKGDRKAAEQAFDIAMSEVAVWAKALGREVPGVHDPLADHKDLADRVAAGELDRAHAIEVANARQQTAAVNERQQYEAETTRSTFEQQQGLQQLVAFDQQMAADPGYTAKRPMLDVMVANIRQTLPPSQWLAATRAAYAQIPDVQVPAPPPPAQPAAPAPSAVRPGGPRAGLAPQKFDSLEDALNFAIDGPAAS